MVRRLDEHLGALVEPEEDRAEECLAEHADGDGDDADALRGGNGRPHERGEEQGHQVGKGAGVELGWVGLWVKGWWWLAALAHTLAYRQTYPRIEMMTSSGRRVTTRRKRQATGEKPIRPDPHVSAALPAMLMAVVGCGGGRGGR